MKERANPVPMERQPLEERFAEFDNPAFRVALWLSPESQLIVDRERPQYTRMSYESLGHGFATNPPLWLSVSTPWFAPPAEAAGLGDFTQSHREVSKVRAIMTAYFGQDYARALRRDSATLDEHAERMERKVAGCSIAPSVFHGLRIAKNALTLGRENSVWQRASDEAAEATVGWHLVARAAGMLVEHHHLMGRETGDNEHYVAAEQYAQAERLAGNAVRAAESIATAQQGLCRMLGLPAHDHDRLRRQSARLLDPVAVREADGTPKYSLLASLRQ